MQSQDSPAANSLDADGWVTRVPVWQCQHLAAITGKESIPQTPSRAQSLARDTKLDADQASSYQNTCVEYFLFAVNSDLLSQWLCRVSQQVTIEGVYL